MVHGALLQRLEEEDVTDWEAAADAMIMMVEVQYQLMLLVLIRLLVIQMHIKPPDYSNNNCSGLIQCGLSSSWTFQMLLCLFSSDYLWSLFLYPTTVQASYRSPIWHIHVDTGSLHVWWLSVEGLRVVHSLYLQSTISTILNSIPNNHALVTKSHYISIFCWF